MAREMNEDKEFSENIDRLLAGQEVGAGEDASEDYNTAIQFAQKLIELGDESSPVFKDQLRRRLLSKLAQQEEKAERQREKRAPFWEALRNPVWRTAAVTVVVAVLAIVVFWGGGIFQAPEQWAEKGPAPAVAPPPRVSTEGPPVAMLDSGAVLELEPVLEEVSTYAPGEEVEIGLVFRNTGSESIIINPFPPAIQISRVETGEVVRAFSQGSESAKIPASGTLSYTLVWNQVDDVGQQVGPGRYSIMVSGVAIQKGAELGEAQADFGPVMELIIQSP